jgi:hypothetical protein
LLLDERILADGIHVRTHASVDGDRVTLHEAQKAIGGLTVAALGHVMQHYGRELEGSIVDSGALTGDALELPGGLRLRRFHYHAIVDAEGRDYLVWERPGQPPLAVVATMATAALRYIALRVAGDAGPDAG